MHPFVKFDLDVRRGDVFGQQRCSAIVILTMIVPNLNNYLDPVTEELMRASYWPLPRDGGQKGVNSGTATDEETSKRTSFFHKMMVMCVKQVEEATREAPQNALPSGGFTTAFGGLVLYGLFLLHRRQVCLSMLEKTPRILWLVTLFFLILATKSGGSTPKFFGSHT